MLVAEMHLRGRQAFWAHRGTLLADAPLKQRLQKHVVLVRQAALWGCQSWPCTEYVLKAANTLQVQIRGMLKQRRGKTEPWLEWHRRSMRAARANIHRCKIERWSTFILTQTWNLYYGHVARGDPVTSSMLAWRGMKWWRVQQTIPESWGGARHAQRFNPMLDTERHIAEIAGLDWQTRAQDRHGWSNLAASFVARHDVPWCSGEQLGLTNLDTNRQDKHPQNQSPLQHRSWW